MNDGCLPAPSAGHDRDGNDLFSFLVGRQGVVEFIDIEILESWYPLLVHEKKPRPGAFGAGTFRSGAGCQMSYEPYGTDEMFGVMLAMRERLPLSGMAGGFPGATTAFLIHRADGTVESIDGHAMNVFLGAHDTFEFLCASGGGWGDPLHREPASVAHDVALGRVTTAEADEIYGVVLDADGNAARRRHRRRVATRSAPTGSHAPTPRRIPSTVTARRQRIRRRARSIPAWCNAATSRTARSAARRSRSRRTTGPTAARSSRSTSPTGTSTS